MEKTFFTRSETREYIGCNAEALGHFPSVPKGTRGTVIKATWCGRTDWVVTVQWNLPRPSWLIDLMIAEISLHFIKVDKSVTDNFCKSEFENLVKLSPSPGPESAHD